MSGYSGWTIAGLGGLALALLCVGCGGGGGDQATTLVVTNLDDSGPGSLRDVISLSSPGGTITFDAGLSGTILLTSGQLSIQKDLTILGPGSSVISVSGAGSSRVFEIEPAFRVFIVDLSITEGSDNGGGVLNAGVLDLVRVFLFNNQAPGTRRGGGLRNVGDLLCEDCTIQNNRGFNGGGFVNDGGTMIMRGCTVTENQTTGNSGAGGANSGGTLHCENCTFSNNQANGGSGGGLAAFASGANAVTTVYFCTFTLNTTDSDGGGIKGAADFDMIFTNTLEVKGTIVAGNTSVAGGPDIESSAITMVTMGFNVVGDDTNSGVVDGLNADQAGTTGALLDPLLAPLADNGGNTLTHALLGGSPAFGAVPVASCTDRDGAPLTVDQTGGPRPGGADCDAGSTEEVP